MYGLCSSRQSIDQLLLGALQSLATELRQLLGVGLSIGQSMQNAQPAGSQEIADDNRQLDPHFFQQALDLVLQSYSVARKLQLHAGHAPPNTLLPVGHET